MTNKVKAEGLVPDRKNCWEYFIKLIRKNLHVVLAFSPVGDDFRNRAKKFPALVNCTVIGKRRLCIYLPMSLAHDGYFMASMQMVRSACSTPFWCGTDVVVGPNVIPALDARCILFSAALPPLSPHSINTCCRIAVRLPRRREPTWSCMF